MEYVHQCNSSTTVSDNNISFTTTTTTITTVNTFEQSFGQDTVITTKTIQYEGSSLDVIIINLHLSNKKDKAQQQISALQNFINTQPNKLIILLGDFNAHFYLECIEECDFSSPENYGTAVFVDKDVEIRHSLYYAKREDRIGNLSSNCHRVRCSSSDSPTNPTTRKMRFETNQGAKLLKLVQVAEDGCVAFIPLTIDFCDAKVDYECFDTGCSDHYLVDFTITVEKRNGFCEREKIQLFRGISFNVFGESVGLVPLNHLEMLTNERIEYVLSYPEVQERVFAIRDAQPPVQTEKGELSFTEAYNGKTLSGALRKYPVFDIHPVPASYSTEYPELVEFFKTTREKFEDAYQEFLTTATDEQKLIGERILTFREQIHNDELLEPFIVEQFKQLAQSKPTFDQVLKSRLEQGVYDVVGLQEVNSQMLEVLRSNQQELESFGYRLTAPETITTKTCGAVLLKV